MNLATPWMLKGPMRTQLIAPLIFDARNTLGSPVVYSPLTVSPLSGGVGTLSPWSVIEGGRLNPNVPPGRATTVAMWGPRSGYMMRLSPYDSDPDSVYPVGASANPSTALQSPGLVSASGTSGVQELWISGTFYLPGAGNTRGDPAFPIIPQGTTSGVGNFMQIFELYGPPYKQSPPWSISIISPSGTSGPNKLFIPSVQPPGFPNFWIDSAALAAETYHDWRAHVIFDTVPTYDGTTRGLLEFWWGPNNTTGVFGSTMSQITFNSSSTTGINFDITSGSNVVSNIKRSGAALSLQIGAAYPVSGTNIPANTYLCPTGNVTTSATSTSGVLLAAGGAASNATATVSQQAVTMSYYTTFNTGKTLSLVTATPGQWNGSALNFLYWNAYRTRYMIPNNVVVYHGHMMAGTTSASVSTATP